MKRVTDQLRGAVALNVYEFGTPRDLRNGVTKVKVKKMPSAEDQTRIYRARAAYQRYVNRLSGERLAFRRIVLAGRIEGLSDERMSLRAGWVLGRALRDIGNHIAKGDLLIYQIHPRVREEECPVSLYAPAGGHVYAAHTYDIEEV